VSSNVLHNLNYFVIYPQVNVQFGSVQPFDRPVPANSVLLQFSVRDWGIGIPKEMLTSVFDEFTQGEGINCTD